MQTLRPKSLDSGETELPSSFSSGTVEMGDLCIAATCPLRPCRMLVPNKNVCYGLPGRGPSVGWLTLMADMEII